MFSDKIKTLDELRWIVGNSRCVSTLGNYSTPRAKIIMCHGTFDVVHVGHIRHLQYCKTKADILIASLTADRHVTKADMRPYIPEALRAYNLAALEMVDYVIIDQNATPVENILALRPDYFAKGYEYLSGNNKTAEEQKAVESYGGEMLFTPGDVVYSSSKLLGYKPNLAAEKLRTLLDSEGLTFDDLRSTLDKMKGKTVHVVGDTIVDSYTYTSLVGGGTKTPTLSVRFETQTYYTGGAAIIAKHVQAIGAGVTFTTVLGNDAHAEFVLNDLKGIKVNPFHDNRPTVNKNVIIAGDYRLLKVDTLDNRSISENVARQIAEEIKKPHDAVIFADFRHGLFNRHTIPRFSEAIPSLTYRAADSQLASRWGNILEFEGFDLITPNEREARFALGDQDSVIRPLALQLYQKANCKTLILKLGERGSITYRNNSESDPHAFFTLDSLAESVVDAVGSGDALLAYSTVAMVATGNTVLASVLGSIAAGLACGVDGNKPVTPEQVLNRINQLERKVNFEAA